MRRAPFICRYQLIEYKFYCEVVMLSNTCYAISDWSCWALSLQLRSWLNKPQVFWKTLPHAKQSSLFGTEVSATREVSLTGRGRWWASIWCWIAKCLASLNLLLVWDKLVHSWHPKLSKRLDCSSSAWKCLVAMWPSNWLVILKSSLQLGQR